MATKVKRLIYIDSSFGTSAGQTRVQVPTAISAQPGMAQRLTLGQLSITHSFYNVNPSNCFFYLFHRLPSEAEEQGRYHEISITNGNYRTTEAMRLSIETAVKAAISLNRTVTGSVGSLNGRVTLNNVAYSSVSRLYKFNFNRSSSNIVELRFFHIKNGEAPVNSAVDTLRAYNQSFQLLGAFASRTPGTGKNGLREVSPDTVGAAAGSNYGLQSHFPIVLDTLSGIMIHMISGETGAYESTSMNANAPNSLRLQESNAFARVPVKRSAFDEIITNVNYEDSGEDLFSYMIPRQSVGTLEFEVRDMQGRPLSLFTDQFDEALLVLNMVLKWELLDDGHTHSAAAEADKSKNIKLPPPKSFNIPESAKRNA